MKKILLLLCWSTNIWAAEQIEKKPSTAEQTLIERFKATEEEYKKGERWETIDLTDNNDEEREQPKQSNILTKKKPIGWFFK